MLISTRQSLPYLSRVTRPAIASAVLATCLLPAFGRFPAQAQDQSFAPTNGRIYVGTIYRVEQPVRADSAIIAIDTVTGDWQIIVEKDATAGGAGNAVRLSPDGRTLVFSRHGDGMWKCESDGQFPIKIFDHRDNWLLRPVWSADSKHLVATNAEYVKKDSEELLRTETWQIDADGRNPVKLPIPDTDCVEDWSPDGQWFVTSSTRRPNASQLYLMKTDGTQERRLTEGGGDGRARFSPDGKKIVYFHQTLAEGRSISTVDVDGGNATKLVEEADRSVPDGAFWSPDGKQIAVVLFDWQLTNGRKVYPSLGTGTFRIEVMDADGSNRRQIPLKGEKIPFISSFGDWR